MSHEKNQDKVKKFHQFIHVEKGPVNTAIIDLLKGNVYQVENEIIHKLEIGATEEIPEFMEAALKEDLIIEVNPNTWIPGDEFDTDAEEDEDNLEPMSIELHVEEGIDLEAVLEKFKTQLIDKLYFYGQENPEIQPGLRQNNMRIIKKEKNFQRCQKIACVDGNFSRITYASYRFFRKYNSCWGTKVAITADGKIRPCIYSEISVGCLHDLETTSVNDMIEKMKPYWELTKDKVEACKDCELRHICLDCREIPRRESGHLLSANPYCSYDPYKGSWNQQK